MTRAEWAEKYGVSEIDMQFIDESRRCGCKIAEVENPPLTYPDIKLEMKKDLTFRISPVILKITKGEADVKKSIVQKQTRIMFNQ